MHTLFSIAEDEDKVTQLNVKSAERPVEKDRKMGNSEKSQIKASGDNERQAKLLLDKER